MTPHQSYTHTAHTLERIKKKRGGTREKREEEGKRGREKERRRERGKT